MILTHDFKDARLRAIAHEPPTIYPVAAADLLRLPACLACASEDTDTIAQVYVGDLEAFTTAACRQCGYIWRSVTPNEAWFAKCAAMLNERPGFSFAGIPTTTEFRALEDSRSKAYARRLEFVEQCVKPKPALDKTKTALDVGAAWGTGSDVLWKRGYYIAAVETDKARADFIRNKRWITVYQAPLEKMLLHYAGFKAPRYSLIMLCHVLEHCRDPKFVLANLHRLLLPDGVAYIEVPSFGIINWSDAFYLAHMSNFSHTSFARLLKHVGSGLHVIASRFFIHEGNRADIGFVLGRRQGIEQGYSVALRDTVSMRHMYRSGLLPYLRDDDWTHVIKYRVPHFSHFNYGLRFNRYSARRAGEFIEFVED